MPDIDPRIIAELAARLRREQFPQNQAIDRTPQMNGVYDAVGIQDNPPPKVSLSDLIARQRGNMPGGNGGSAPPAPPPMNVPSPSPVLAQDDPVLPNNAMPTAGAMPPLPGMQPPAAISAPPQPASFGEKLSQGLANNSDLLLALGAGLVGAPNIAAGAQRAFANAAPIAGQNQTVQALTKLGLSEDLARSAARNPKIMNMLLPAVFGTKDKTELVKNYEFARSQGFGGSFLDWIAAQRAGAGEYGLQPIYGTGPDGKPVILQLGKSGQATASKIPEGISISTGMEKVDLGTQVGILDKKSGQIVGYLPKDVAGVASEKERGGDIATFESIKSKMPGLEKVVSRLDDLSNKATYTAGGRLLDAAGRQLGMEPRESAVARAEYVSTVDNQILPLLRDTFGAQFTQKEGETLRATLGNPDMHPKEKQAVLKSFIEQKRRDVEALASRTGAVPPASAPAPSQSQSGGFTVKAVR